MSKSKPWTPEFIKPWTPEQVDALNARQADQSRHPYTCPGEPICEPGVTERNLVATPDGWVCYCGRYRQHWAHAADMGGPHAC